MIDWNHFTPWTSLAGGLLIGLAAALFVLGLGRIAGIATLVASPMFALLRRQPLAPEATRFAFVLGLLVAPTVWQLWAPMPVAHLSANQPMLIAAGLLVGIGTRMGNGCTSGHGVCGLSRRSLRSLVNVLYFMGAGVATVFVLRHVL